MSSKILIFMMCLLTIIGGLNIAVLLFERMFHYWNRLIWERTRFLQWLNLVGLSDANKEKLENFDLLYKAACTACEYIGDNAKRAEMYERIKGYFVEDFDV